MVTESESDENSSFVRIPKDSKSSSGSSEQQYFVGFYDNTQSNTNRGLETHPSGMTPNTVKHQKVLAAPEIINEYPVLSGGMFGEP